MTAETTEVQPEPEPRLYEIRWCIEEAYELAHKELPENFRQVFLQTFLKCLAEQTQQTYPNDIRGYGRALLSKDTSTKRVDTSALVTRIKEELQVAA